MNKTEEDRGGHTLEQWRMLAAVVDAGSFAAGAEALGKSQSALSHGIQRLQAALGIALLTQQGRRAVLTLDGETLLRRARHLLDEAAGIQRLAGHLAQGHEPLLRLAVDVIFPPERLFAALTAFSSRYPNTRIELLETVLSGSTEALLRQEADLVITGRVPPGFLGEPLYRSRFVHVAHPAHPLHVLGRLLTESDLAAHRQIVVRDSGLKQNVDAGWLGAEQRWTVSHLSTSIAALTSGLGFAAVPLDRIQHELAAGLLKPLPLENAGNFAREVMLYLVSAERDRSGPAVRALMEALRAAAM